MNAVLGLPIPAAIGIACAAVIVVWTILVLISLVFRPKMNDGTRVIEVMLIVTSALMICGFAVVYLLLQARGLA